MTCPRDFTLTGGFLSCREHTFAGADFVQTHPRPMLSGSLCRIQSPSGLTLKKQRDYTQMC